MYYIQISLSIFFPSSSWVLQSTRCNVQTSTLKIINWNQLNCWFSLRQQRRAPQARKEVVPKAIRPHQVKTSPRAESRSNTRSCEFSKKKIRCSLSILKKKKKKKKQTGVIMEETRREPRDRHESSSQRPAPVFLWHWVALPSDRSRTLCTSTTEYGGANTSGFPTSSHVVYSQMCGAFFGNFVVLIFGNFYMTSTIFYPDQNSQQKQTSSVTLYSVTSKHRFLMGNGHILR